MNRNSRPLHFVPAALVIAVALYGLATSCGGNKTEDTTSATTTPAPTTPGPDTGAAGGAMAGTLAEGQALYSQRCALCHGADGRGDGPGAKGLNPPPRNHHDQAYMNARSDAELLTVIRDGKGAMPAWGKVLTETQIQSLLLYVRELGKTP